MAGDYSRVSFDSRKRFAAVLMQQGRVQLDADWNEQAAILHRRMEVQAREVFGRVAASRFGTQDAFRIGIVAGPPRDLSIQPGRYWVDGRLAEALASDGAPPTYLRQPFLPAPPALPQQGGAIVYLETWEREVTWVEDPALLDVALGGVDTAARLQAVWQVRVLARQDAACGLDLDPIFPPSPARLTTAAVAPPAPEDPCLVAPRTGYRGLENRLYRVEVHRGGDAATARFKWSRDNASVRSPVLGLRREIRGAVEVSVLSVARIGRDPGLRLDAGDWVEITDEHRFLNNEPGEMARIAEPPLEQPGDDGVQVVLDRVLPGGGRRAFGADAAQLAARRTRIIRWDQAAPRNAVDADGLMTVGTNALALEEGVEVRFSLAAPGASFRAGDHWVFAARTADASVEVLAASPPHGPHRRYAMLAAFTEIGRGDTPSDCRTLWPPLVQGGEGCCTIIVRPGDDLQAAVDRLGQQGGCICLKPGVHELRDTLRIRGGRISIHAEAPGAAMLRRAGQVPLMAIGGGTASASVRDVHVAGIVFQLGSLDTQRDVSAALIEVDGGAAEVEISDCRFMVQDFAGQTPATRIAGAGVAVRRCRVERLPIGVAIGGMARDVVVEDCSFLATSEEGAEFDPGLVAIGAEACDGTLRILRNAASHYRQGIVLGTEGGKGIVADLVAIDGNVILRSAPPARSFEPADTIPGAAPVAEVPAAVRDIVLRGNAMRSAVLAGDSVAAFAPANRTLSATRDTVATRAVTALLPGVSDSEALFAIVAAGRNVTVTENWLSWNSPLYGGVLADNGVRLVHGNDLLYRGAREEETPTLVFGIAAGTARGGGGIVVSANAVQGPLLAVAIGDSIAVTVQDNIVSRALVAVLASGAAQPRIIGNTLVAVEVGVALLECAQPAVEDNLVLASMREAVQLISTGRNGPGGLARIAGNTLLNCGHGEDATATAISAIMIDPLIDKDEPTVTGAEVLVAGNLVADTGVAPGGKGWVGRLVAISIAAPRATVRDNEVRWDAPLPNEAGQKLLSEQGGRPHRALLVTGLPASSIGIDRPFAEALSIHGNRIRGYAADALVEVVATRVGEQEGARFLSLLFGDNIVQHWGPLDTAGIAPTILLRADPQATVSVTGNVVRGPGRRPSFAVEGPKQIAFAGNASTGPLIGATGDVNVVI